MERMKDNIVELCKMTELGLHNFLSEFVKNNYERYTITDQYIIAEGKVPVCLVAHMDTVFNIPPEDFFYDPKESVLWSPDGLGTDDRAGVYAILEIVLRYKLKPHIIFTMGEEKGGIGAHSLVTDFPECPFAELNFIIELDRQGHNDCVFYSCDNNAFTKFIKKFGFAYETGTFTDISVIAPKWKAAAVNLSVGYYNEHTYTELLCVKSLARTIHKVVKILKTENLQSYDYVPRKETSYGKYVKWWSSTRCAACNKYLGNTGGVKVNDVLLTEDDFRLCRKCYEDFYGPQDIDIPMGDEPNNLEIEELSTIEWTPSKSLLV